MRCFVFYQSGDYFDSLNITAETQATSSHGDLNNANIL